MFSKRLSVGRSRYRTDQPGLNRGTSHEVTKAKSTHTTLFPPPGEEKLEKGEEENSVNKVCDISYAKIFIFYTLLVRFVVKSFSSGNFFLRFLLHRLDVLKIFFVNFSSFAEMFKLSLQSGACLNRSCMLIVTQPFVRYWRWHWNLLMTFDIFNYCLRVNRYGSYLG